MARQSEDAGAAQQLVRAEGLEPSRAFAQRIFVPATAFAAPAACRVCGLDYPFAMSGTTAGCRRCPSSLYTFLPASAVRLGSGFPWIEGFPEFEQFCISGFPEEHPVDVIQVRCVYRFRHARTARRGQL